MTVTGVEDATAVRTFGPDDVVKVRIEPWPSLVVPSSVALPPLPLQAVRKRRRILWWLNRETPNGGLDLPSTCCVPIVLVRTPAWSESGILRWVEINDLTPW